MNPKKHAYENLADSIIEKFYKRGIEGYYCDNREEALEVVKRFLTPGCSVSWGGSESIKEIGLMDLLEHSDYILYNRKDAETPEEAKELYGKIVTCDYFFMSSNAITLDGELINIDGTGNRVSCLCYGPENVIIVAGMNKIVPDVKAGIDRTRNVAAPPNGVRLNTGTPCAEIGRCGNCLTDGCMCCEVVITRKSRIPSRIKVILVGEELGF